MMRLCLSLTGNTEPVPFNHLDLLAKAVHQWLRLDEKKQHQTTFFSFGWLQGGRAHNNALTFRNGASWRISLVRDDDAYQLSERILASPYLGFGMKVFDVVTLPPPTLASPQRLLTDMAPIIVRRKRRAGSYQYLLWHHPETDRIMTQILRKKLAHAGYSDHDLDVVVSFDRSYRNAHSKLTTLNGIPLRGSVCPIVIKGTTRALTFAWAAGIGSMNDWGFGALR